MKKNKYYITPNFVPLTKICISCGKEFVTTQAARELCKLDCKIK